MNKFLVWLLVGFVIGMLFEYFVWIYRCRKRNLFGDDYKLRDLSKEKKK